MQVSPFVLTLFLSVAGSAASAAVPASETGRKDSVVASGERSGSRRLTVGGYGEAVASRNFYSDNWKRYTDASKYRNDKGHGRFDLPHVTLFLGYDFGHGWSMGSEIEFEHGGTESAVEIEEEETGEYESEIERGGEVALEQFWLQKSFMPQFNVRLGHIIVPVGPTNNHHSPTEYFGVYRPEGDNTILPCTWHETGVSLWGRAGAWRYEALFVAGLDADRFNNQNWIQGGAGSPYEFKIANAFAGAFRLDNYSVPGLRMSLSGYYGKSASNSLKQYKFESLDGRVLIGAFDFAYDAHQWVARGGVTYGYLSNSAEIAEANRSLKGMGISPGTNIGETAISVGVEAGYNLLALAPSVNPRHRLYLFGRYDYYDPMLTMGRTDKGVQLADEEQWGRQRVAVGLNYYPLPQIVIKGEYSYRIFKSQYNNEPSVSLGIAYSGLFTR